MRWQVWVTHESGLSTHVTQKIRRIKMHVTEKIVDENGVHILTSQIEADGPFAICSKDAKLEAKVIGLQRTESGGVKLQVALTVEEPKPEAAPVAEPAAPLPTVDEEALAYLVNDKGLKKEEAQAAVDRFGAAKIIANRNKERDEELAALLAKK